MDNIVIEIPWHPPQDLTIRKVGAWDIFSIIDRFGRRVFFHGTYVGYRVAVFKTRIYQSVSQFIVYGNWESAIYVDHSGRYHAVIIHAKKEA